VDTGLTTRLFTVLSLGSRLVVLGDKGVILDSPDGLTWTSESNSNIEWPHHGVSTGSQLIIATADGVMTSSDGLNWQRTLQTRNRMFAVATNGMLSVAVGSPPNAVFTSPDGLNWTQQSVDVGHALAGAAWTDKQFLIAGDGDGLGSSPDGVTWTAHSTGTGLTMADVAVHGGTLAAVTKDGAILINRKIPKTKTVRISIAPGKAGSPPQVSLACATPGAQIFYTDNGEEPSRQSKPYIAPFSPAYSGVVQARAYKNGLAPSDPATADVTFDPPN
jgi:hypothetical protein